MTSCGIGAIINNINEKRFIFKSKDLDKRIENYNLQLNKGCHYNYELQKDWNKLGSENFSFETREITLNDDNELNSRYIHHVNICNDIYNIFDSKNLFKEELSSKIEILSYKLDVATGKQNFNENFLNDLNKLNLDIEDGEKFRAYMLNKIKSDEINYYNFDLKFNSLLNEMAKNKQEDMENKKKQDLLIYLHSVVGYNNNSSIFTKMLENHNLTQDMGLSIRIELEEMINNNKINTAFEIDEKLDEILKRNQKDKLQYENQRKMSLKKLYSLTGDYVPKAQYIYKLNTLGLSIDDGNLIKKELERKIELNEISFADVEIEFEKEIQNKLKFIKETKENKKSNLLNLLYETTGKDNISNEFKNQLQSHDLHENIGIQIQSNIINQIEIESINDSDQLITKIQDMISQKEKDDVMVRLNSLSKKDIDNILKMNSINSFIPLKSAKVLKIIETVPLKIIKENIKFLGYDVNVNFVENPKIIFCSECGFKNTSDSIYCSECGYKLE